MSTTVTTSRNVWICDQHADTSNVLKALYEPRGAQVRQIQAVRQIEQPAFEDQPDLIILNVSSQHPIASAVEMKYQSVPRIVIGRAPAIPNPVIDKSAFDESALDSMFQYKDLICRVDSILSELED